MEIDLIFKIAAVGIIVAILHSVLTKSGRDEQALMVTIAGLLVVVAVIVKEFVSVFALLRQLFNL